jgi:peptidyl-prolyl cis-trans isomerase A (cyclophilin A)
MTRVFRFSCVLGWVAGMVCLVSCGDGRPRTALTPPDDAYLDPSDPQMNETAPDSFGVVVVTTRGEFILEVRREWAPRGVDRFYNLVRTGYYDQCRFFRVIDDFMAQFGVHGDPGVNAIWRYARIDDDPARVSNARGTIVFAKTGEPNSRTTQLFINFEDNSFLDGQGFAPFGRVVAGMEVVDSLYSGYGDAYPRGLGPDQGRIQTEGNAYLIESFPRLDFIQQARVRQ